LKRQTNSWKKCFFSSKQISAHFRLNLTKNTTIALKSSRILAQSIHFIPLCAKNLFKVGAIYDFILFQQIHEKSQNSGSNEKKEYFCKK